MILYRLFFVVAAIALLPATGSADSIKRARRPKHHGLLTQSAGTVGQPAIETLSSLPQKNIDLTTQIDSLDAASAAVKPETKVITPVTTTTPVSVQVSTPAKSLSVQSSAASIVPAEDQKSATQVTKVNLPIDPSSAKVPRTQKSTASIVPSNEQKSPDSATIADQDTQSKQALERLNPSSVGSKKDELQKNSSSKDASSESHLKGAPKKTAIKNPLDFKDDTPSIEFYFENTDLQNLLNQISDIFHITFITDEIISPLSPGAKALKGNKISFKTQEPLTKRDAWNLFLTFLDLAGLAIIPQGDPRMFRISATEAAQRSSVRSFIGVDSSMLPDNDELIRYVYFVENSSVDTIRAIIDSLRSPSALFQVLQESKAFILTDKSYNIKALMNIVKELDKSTLPQALSVLKLKRVDAKQVKDLYDSIIGKDENIASRLFPNRKQASSLYFPENTRIFAEPRTNTLILLGPKDAIKKIEDFITQYIDVEIDKPYSPLKVYTLQYADAQTVSDIMNTVSNFGKNTEAGKAGGVRGEDKFLKPMSFTPEKDTNRVIIKGDYDDYIRAIEIIKKLDEPQPQVAIEMLLLDIGLVDSKNLGSQIRSAVPGINGLVGDNVKFQTSGNFVDGSASSIVENTAASAGVNRLLGNILNLVTGTNASNTAGPGNTVVSLGSDQFGVWGIFSVLQTVANLQVISNPFVTAINKAPATVTLGETRRVVTAQVVNGGGTNTNAFGNQDANLTVNITPQINSDGFIILTLNIQYDNFLDASDPQSARTQKRTITTNTIVADKEVLAIGGLIQNRVTDTESKVPILGDIPIIGWLFKNRQKVQSKSNLLILLSTRIVEPTKGIAGPFTAERVKDYRDCLTHIDNGTQKRDPIDKWMFASTERDTEKVMDDFLFKRQDKSIGLVADSPDKVLNRAQRRKNARKARRREKQARLKQLEHGQAQNLTTSRGIA
jgi:general secretion pathway protein D